MRVVSQYVFLALVAWACALPTGGHSVVHEKRKVGSAWNANENVKIDRQILLPVRIGLKQTNLDRGDELLKQVSDPESESYGRHFTLEEVTTLWSHCSIYCC